MWVFGYGSLMWDGWQAQFNCRRSCAADLPGYTRKLNKASVERWGTKDKPGPTLNLSASEGSNCRGMAFEFSADQEAAVTRYLRKREGGFELMTVLLRLEDGSQSDAITPIYRGKNLIVGASDDKLIAMISHARGTAGSATQYVHDLAKALAKLEVHDDGIEALVKRLS